MLLTSENLNFQIFLGKELDSIQFGDFGEVGELIVTKDDTLMLNGKGSQAHIDNRCQQIIGAMDDCSSGSAIKHLNTYQPKFLRFFVITFVYVFMA